MVSSQWGAALVRRWGPIRTSQVALLAARSGCCWWPCRNSTRRADRRAAARHRLWPGHAGEFGDARAHDAARALCAGVLGQADGRASGWRAGGPDGTADCSTRRRRRALAAMAALCLAGIALARSCATARRRHAIRTARADRRHSAGPARTLVLQHPALRRIALCTLVFSAVQVSLTAYLGDFPHRRPAIGRLVAAGGALSPRKARASPAASCGAGWPTAWPAPPHADRTGARDVTCRHHDGAAAAGHAGRCRAWLLVIYGAHSDRMERRLPRHRGTLDAARASSGGHGGQPLLHLLRRRDRPAAVRHARRADRLAGHRVRAAGRTARLDAVGTETARREAVIRVSRPVAAHYTAAPGPSFALEVAQASVPRRSSSMPRSPTTTSAPLAPARSVGPAGADHRQRRDPSHRPRRHRRQSVRRQRAGRRAREPVFAPPRRGAAVHRAARAAQPDAFCRRRARQRADRHRRPGSSCTTACGWCCRTTRLRGSGTSSCTTSAMRRRSST